MEPDFILDEYYYLTLDVNHSLNKIEKIPKLVDNLFSYNRYKEKLQSLDKKVYLRFYRHEIQFSIGSKTSIDEFLDAYVEPVLNSVKDENQTLDFELYHLNFTRDIKKPGSLDTRDCRLLFFPKNPTDAIKYIIDNVRYTFKSDMELQKLIETGEI